jgi:hypothetical protein
LAFGDAGVASLNEIYCYSVILPRTVASEFPSLGSSDKQATLKPLSKTQWVCTLDSVNPLKIFMAVTTI